MDGAGIVSADPRTVVVNVITVLVPAFTDAGLKDAVVAVGNPLAENTTVPGNAPPTVAVPIVIICRLTRRNRLRRGGRRH